MIIITKIFIIRAISRFEIRIRVEKRKLRWIQRRLKEEEEEK